MNLDDAQKKQVAAWIAEGLKLSEIQSRLGKELGVAMTYMEVRMLVDDLKLSPKDPEPPKPSDLGLKSPEGPAPGKPGATGPEALLPAEDELPAGRVSVIMDKLARPGSLVSGKVTFSDGKQAEWYLDQAGRLGLVPKEPGYKPSAIDVQEFQYALQGQLEKLGM